MSQALKNKEVFWVGKGEKDIVRPLLPVMSYQMYPPHPVEK